jgi:hypothetical protein
MNPSVIAAILALVSIVAAWELTKDALRRAEPPQPD